MRIGEIAERTGLNISNIRFYERKGLIGPDREPDSKYRNYTENDLERLNLIILYRRMDLSVETIGRILKEEVSVEDTLEQQLIDLKARQQMLQSSIDLCQKVIDDQAYDPIDLKRYLEYVKEEEANGKIFEKIDDFLEDFSDFTNFDHLLRGGLFPRPWMNRVMMVIWCAFFGLIPLIGIADSLLDENGVSPVRLIFWGGWSALFIFSFLYAHKVHKQ